MKHPCQTKEHCRKMAEKRWLRDFKEPKIRFWNLVLIGAENECWLWKRKSANRYPLFSLDRGKTHSSASRVAWILTNGPINGPKIEVCHSCDNTQCCNPKHLFLGTHLSNMRDMSKKGRAVRNRFPRNKGEQCHSSKLTEDKVKAIRLMHIPWKCSYSDLAVKFNVHRSTIASIIERRTWPHI